MIFNFLEFIHENMWMQHIITIFWVGAFIITIYKLMHPTKKEWKQMLLLTVALCICAEIFKEGVLCNLTTMLCFGGMMMTILKIHERNIAEEK